MMPLAYLIPLMHMHITDIECNVSVNQVFFIRFNSSRPAQHTAPEVCFLFLSCILDLWQYAKCEIFDKTLNHLVFMVGFLCSFPHFSSDYFFFEFNGVSHVSRLLCVFLFRSLCFSLSFAFTSQILCPFFLNQPTNCTRAPYMWASYICSPVIWIRHQSIC